MTESELNEYFKSKKDSWFTTDGGGNTKWDNDKVEKFWHLIREEKIKKNDFNFDNFIFPYFQERDLNSIASNNNNFWVKGEKKVLKFNLNFRNVTFLGECHFFYVDFTNEVIFRDCNFHARVYFQRCNFEKKLDFKRVDFNRKLFIKKNLFKHNLSFQKVYFKAYARIYKNRISNNLDIYWCNFRLVHFTDIKSKKISLRWVVFNAKATFHYLTFDKFFFEYINSNHDSNLSNFIEPPILIFKGIYNDTNTYFTDVNLTNTAFTHSELKKINFNKCIWKINKERLILKDELINLKDAIEHYRQLKSSFQKNQDWELAGYSYTSEMKIRQILLKNEKRYFHWFFYWFYGFFSGYTQNYIRSILSLIFLILIFSVLYFFIDFNILKSIERSVNASLPMFKTNNEELYPEWWIILRNVQLLFSGIFISFFILSLRKRFKQ